MLSFLISTVLKSLVVSNDKVNGRVLWLDIGWHWLLKKSLKNSAFSAKFVTNLVSTNNEGMIGAFSLITKVLVIY